MSAYSYTLAADGPAPLGLVVLQSDETIEKDMRVLLGEDAPFVTRVPSGETVSAETLQAMEQHIPAAAGLLPGAQRFGAIGYGCTSGTAQIGPGRIAELVMDGAATDHVTDPLSALVAACQALGLRKLAFLSPYVAQVSGRLRGALEAKGITTPVFGSFNEAEEAKVVRIDAQSVIRAATDLCEGQQIDGLFLSCTNLRTLGVIDALEARLSIPVLSSNLVLGWHLAQLGRIKACGPGRLIAHQSGAQA